MDYESLPGEEFNLWGGSPVVTKVIVPHRIVIHGKCFYEKQDSTIIEVDMVTPMHIKVPPTPGMTFLGVGKFHHMDKVEH